MTEYKINNIGDIFLIPEEHAKEFFQDLIEQYYTIKRKGLKFKDEQAKDKCIMFFKPDGQHKQTIYDMDGNIVGRWP